MWMMNSTVWLSALTKSLQPTSPPEAKLLTSNNLILVESRRRVVTSRIQLRQRHISTTLIVQIGLELFV